jgi:serine/threonine-protein phosphatase 2A activator
MAAELAPYLVNSFGNRTHIDYGMGHKMTFVIFVCGLFKVSFLMPKNMVAVGLKVFSAYFDLARYFQTRYRMGMADSMDMWNLDAYQFVALILRVAQLSQRARVKPNAIVDPKMGLRSFLILRFSEIPSDAVQNGTGWQYGHVEPR